MQLYDCVLTVGGLIKKKNIVGNHLRSFMFGLGYQRLNVSSECIYFIAS